MPWSGTANRGSLCASAIAIQFGSLALEHANRQLAMIDGGTMIGGIVGEVGDRIGRTKIGAVAGAATYCLRKQEDVITKSALHWVVQTPGKPGGPRDPIQGHVTLDAPSLTS